MTSTHLCPGSEFEVELRSKRRGHSLDLCDPTRSQLANKQHTQAPCNSTVRSSAGGLATYVDGLLHGAQTLGGIHPKQWEYRRDKATGSPKWEELPFALGPRCQRPANTHGDETDAPNRSVGVPELVPH